MATYYGSGLQYRRDIDGLRAVAVVPVVAFHVFPWMVPSGFVGVDVFFAISGFLISQIIFSEMEQGRFNILNFWGRRVRRIFPALLCVLVFVAVGGWHATMVPDFSNIGQQIWAGAGFFENILLCHHSGYFDSSIETKPLMHLWSLAIEEQFYIVFPVIVFLLWKFKADQIKLTILVLLALSSLAWAITETGSDPAAAFYLLPSRFWEFLAGGLLARFTMTGALRPCASDRRDQIRRDILSCVGIGLIAVGAFFIPSDNFPNAFPLVPITGTVLLLWAGPQATINRHVLARRWAVFIGRISYPLYLWHWPLLSYARLTQDDLGTPMRVGILVLSFAMAALTYRYVETPIRSGVLRRTATVSLAAGMAAIGFAGYAIHAAQGFPSRFNAEALRLADYHYDMAASTRLDVCWLTTQPYDDASPQCYGGLKSGRRKETTLIWGDSYAAHLYAGLAAISKDKKNIAQFNRAACLMQIHEVQPYKLCFEGNQFVMRVISKYQPATVILYANWLGYGGNWKSDGRYTNELVAVVDWLKRAGVEHIIVVGPTPGWRDDLPRIMFNLSRHVPSGELPLKLKDLVAPAVFAIDAQLRAALKDSPATYVSGVPAFCDQDGCLARTRKQDVTSLTVWDTGHLTVEGAILLASRLPLAN